MSNKKLIVIAGPTAIGKTSLSIKIAKHLQTEIISADSRQVYKEMSIGTAKPTNSERVEITHHFIDIISIQNEYNVARYEEQVIHFLDHYFQNNDTAVLTGGTGLYIKAITKGLDALPTIPDAMNAKVIQLLKENGISHLQNIIAEKDPEYYKKVDKENVRRLIRAVSVIEHTGMPFSDFRKGIAKKRNFDIIPISLHMERTILYDRINKRVDLMIQAGLEEEVRSLSIYKDLQALQTVGYKELFQYFSNVISREEAINKIKQHTRNYGKRQITWFKNQYKAHIFSHSEVEKILNHIESTL